MKLSIPDPCKMSINDMKPIEGGYHCDSCAHSVVDFRNWSTEDIQQYFKAKNGDRVCGIVNKPKEETITIYASENTFYRGISRLFLVALIFTFANLFSGCNFQNPFVIPLEDPPLAGVIMPDTANNPDLNRTVETDTTHHTIGFTVPTVIDEKADTSISKNVDCYVKPIVINHNEEIEIGNVVSDYKNDTLATEQLFLGVIIEDSPEFPGGQEGINRFIRQNIVYPEYERKNKIEGKVYVEFTVNEKGDVEDAKIIRGVNGAPNFDTEVLRVINLMPRWKPGIEAGKPKKVKFNLPVEFKL